MIQVITKAPLVNFDSTAGTVTVGIGPQAEVTLLPDWVLDDDSLPSELNEFQLYILRGGGQKRTWCLAITKECNEELPANDLRSRSLAVDRFGHDGERTIDEIVTVLRLLKPERIWAPLVWTVAWDEHGDCLGSSISNHGARWDAIERRLLSADADPLLWSATDLFPNPYILDTSAASSLDAVARRLIEGEDLKEAGSVRLDLAIRRFNMACDRSRPEDELIDLFVALEALYVDAPKDVTDQLATRISRHLESRSERTSLLDDEVRGTYRVRGEVVHGSSNVGGVRRATGVAEEILRRSLHKFMASPSSFEIVLSIPAQSRKHRSNQ